MAPSFFSLLFRHHNHHHLLRRNNHRILSSLLTFRPLSTTSEPPKPSSLSDRLSFVFDKIDEIEKERSEKDEALQRIRSWRQSKNTKSTDIVNGNDSVAGNKAVANGDEPGLGLGFGEENDGELNRDDEKGKKLGLGLKREIELTHPWPEWIALMERLVEQNYFDHKRKDEDNMVENLGEEIDLSNFVDEHGFDFTRDWKTVQTAILNFGRDRFDIMRSLLRQDIQTLVGYGCPSADKKAVFSSKLLRKHAHLDEGDVCSTCSLRNTCERAYLVTNKEDEARTIDVMRVLLTYGFDHINGSVENKTLLKQKSVKSVVRKLLHEVVRLSAVPIDPNLPPPVIKPRPPKVKQPPPPPRKRVGRDDVEMKKGDWLCPKCNFMNFAKNVVCLQCDAKRPKRQLLPGEWECPQCNFLNYRRNMTCFNCEHKRPPDEYIENQVENRQHRPATRLERAANRTEVSNAWNFDFDDDESDGADVAAFEYADSRALNEDRLLDSQPEDSNFSRGPNEDAYRVSRSSRFQEKEHSRPAQMEHRAGFDDFDDEDDDIDSYELDDKNRNKNQEAPSVNFSDVEAYSESENDDDLPGYSRTGSSSRTKSGSREHDPDFDSDDDLPVHPKWKSSHVADSGLRDRGSSRRRSLRSDEDDKLVFGSDDDDDVDKEFSSKRGRGNDRDTKHRGSWGSSRRMKLRSDEDDGLVFDSDDDVDEEFSSRRSRGNDGGCKHRGVRRRGDDSKEKGFRGRSDVNFVRGNDFGDEFGTSRGGRGGGQRRSYDKRGGGQQGSSGRRQGGFEGMDGRQRGRQGFSGSRQRGSSYGGGGGGRNYNDDSNKWSNLDNERPARQRINVR